MSKEAAVAYFKFSNRLKEAKQRKSRQDSPWAYRYSNQLHPE
jgi:hypothetical protein